MANLQVKNVPEDMHAELRRRAAAQHISVRDYVLALIRKDQELPTLNEWLDRVVARGPLPGAEDIDAAEVIREGRRERDAEIAASLGLPPLDDA